MPKLTRTMRDMERTRMTHFPIYDDDGVIM